MKSGTVIFACVNTTQVHEPYIRVIYLVGYSMSLIALAIAVAIMLYIKSVQFSSRLSDGFSHEFK